MKIPTAAPGAAPFYHGGPPINGMEMNPQAWQGNGGVMPEGGAPGNGAMYMMTQPAHMPTAYVGGPPAGYYGPGMPPGVQHQHPHQQGGNVPLPHPIPVPAQDFSEYMWMENEEEFDKQVMQQLEEEALMEQCIEAMLADEREASQRGSTEGMEEQISKSTLNPLAREFVPTFGPPSTAAAPSIPSNPEIDCPSPDNSTPSPLSSESDAQKSISPAHTSPQKNIKDVSPNNKPTEDAKVAPVSEDSKEDSPAKKTEVVANVVKVAEVAAKPPRTEGSRPPAKPSSANTAAHKKGKPDPVKKAAEAVKPADNTDGVKSSKAKENAKPNKVTKESAPRNATPTAAKKTEVKKEVVKTSAKVVSELSDDFRNALNTTVDLQGPPLPVSSAAISSAAPVESEKPAVQSPALPAAPAVFNYAAAARANLPPKQSAAAAPASAAPSSTPAPNKQEPTVASNNSSVSRETTPTAKNASSAKSNASNQQRGASKESNSSTNSSSKGPAAPSSSFAKMTAGGNNRKAKK